MINSRFLAKTWLSGNDNADDDDDDDEDHDSQFQHKVPACILNV